MTAVYGESSRVSERACDRQWLVGASNCPTDQGTVSKQYHTKTQGDEEQVVNVSLTVIIRGRYGVCVLLLCVVRCAFDGCGVVVVQRGNPHTKNPLRWHTSEKSQKVPTTTHTRERDRRENQRTEERGGASGVARLCSSGVCWTSLRSCDTPTSTCNPNLTVCIPIPSLSSSFSPSVGPPLLFLPPPPCRLALLPLVVPR